MDPVTFLFFFKLLFLQLTTKHPENSYFQASLSGRGSADIADTIEISAKAKGEAYGKPSATSAPDYDYDYDDYYYYYYYY